MNTKELRKEFGLTQEGLSEQTGIPKGRINSWEQRGSNPKYKDYQILLSFFESIRNHKNTNDFNYSQTENIPLTNKVIPFNNIYNQAEEIGEIKNVEESLIEYKSGNAFIDIGNGKMQMLIPLVEQYAYAGYLSGYSNSEFLEELPKFSIIVDKHHKGEYRGFNVRGDSMDDNTKNSISNGEIAVGRKINKELWKSKLHLFQWQNYVIVHEEGIIIKRITQHDVEKGIITCVSLNPDKTNYPDFEIKLSEVHELYNIVQIVRNNF